MTHLEKAEELRARTDVHFNCCQAVLVTFAQEMGLTEEQAYDLGANFGSGMRCGSVCGTLTAALIRRGTVHRLPAQVPGGPRRDQLRRPAEEVPRRGHPPEGALRRSGLRGGADAGLKTTKGRLSGAPWW